MFFDCARLALTTFGIGLVAGVALVVLGIALVRTVWRRVETQG